MRTTTTLVACLIWSGCRAPQIVSETPVESRDHTAARPVHGSLATRYRGRFGGGDRDQDVYSVLSLDIGDREHGAWSGSLIGEAAADIDGRPESSSAFASIGDDEFLRTRLYEAFADHQGTSAIERARFGRQIDFETPVIVTFDGLALRSKEIGSTRATIGAYAGIPVRFDSAANSGDNVLGASFHLHPWKKARLRADWMHVEDRAYFGRASDDLMALDLRQRVGDHVDVEGDGSTLNGEARDVHGAATYTDAEGDFVVRASLYRLVATQNELGLDFDPYTRILLAQFPYTQLAFSAAKSLGDDTRVEAGFDTRRIDDEGDEGPFNRNFERAFVVGTLEDVCSSGLSLTLSADRWNSGTDENDAIGVDVSKRIGAHTRASIGTAYALYQYDLFQLEERDHVRTWYAAYRVRRKEGMSFDVRYEHEDSLHDYDTLRLGFTWRF